MDAKEFIRYLIRLSNEVGNTKSEDERKPVPPVDYLKFDHVYMNLPVLAVEFLDVFQGAFVDANPEIWCKDPSDIKTIQLPLIHIYGFTFEKEKDKAFEYFLERIGKALDYKLTKEEVTDFHHIRDVSSTSHKYSTSFRLPYEVAMRKMNSD